MVRGLRDLQQDRFIRAGTAKGSFVGVEAGTLRRQRSCSQTLLARSALRTCGLQPNKASIRVLTGRQCESYANPSERLTRTALQNTLHQHCARDTWRRAPYAACLPPPLRTMRSSLVAALSGLRRNQNLRGLSADASRRPQRHRLLNDSLMLHRSGRRSRDWAASSA